MTADSRADARAAITLAREVVDADSPMKASRRHLAPSANEVVLARGVLALQALGDRLRFLLDHAPSPNVTPWLAQVTAPERGGAFTRTWAGRTITQEDVDKAVHDWDTATTDRGGRQA